MIVLDTHIWVWWVSQPQLLSEKVQRAIRSGIQEKKIFLSCISAWEVAMLVKKERLKLTMSAEDWIRKSENLSFLTFLPVDNTILLRSISLPEKINNDPADRIIIATALLLGAMLITKDSKIRKAKVVDTIW